MIKLNDTPIEINHFPDGTPRLNIDIPLGRINIKWLYEPNEEMALYYIVKHIRNGYEPEAMDLYLPYIPNARMDRVKKDSEVFTLKYFCEFINSLNFSNVMVRDAHSNVSLALLDRVISQDVHAIIDDLKDKLLKPDRDVIVYPDEGAGKRYSELVKFPYAFGIKKRNWDDGEIVGLEIQGELPYTPFNALIVDDISSYGGTFLHTAKKLKELGAEKVWLYISHCENSILDGELIKSGLLEKIYTTKSIFTKQHELIEVIGG